MLASWWSSDPARYTTRAAALEYAGRLKVLADRYAGQLIVVLRCYFEKPRTSIGWKGLINDPDLDGSFHVNKGLRLARKLLLDVNGLGLPTASEFLDTQIPQYIDDLTSWVAMGRGRRRARCTANWRRAVDAGGFKNSTDGNVQPAIDAVGAAASEHWFPGVTKQGVSAIFHTTGNPTCHVILRGGAKPAPTTRPSACRGVRPVGRDGAPARADDRLLARQQREEAHRTQIDVASAVAAQVAPAGRRTHLRGHDREPPRGRQPDYVAGRPAVHGQSITDACLSFEQTEPLLEDFFAKAQVQRGVRADVATA